MRLLDSESLETAQIATGLPGDLDAQSFYVDLWNVIKHAESVGDDNDMLGLERQLRGLCKDYYRQASHMIAAERGQTGSAVEDDFWDRQEKNVMEKRRKAFERQLQRYVICYMHLNRALVQSRSEIEKIVRDFPHEIHAGQLQITDVTGSLIRRALRQKQELMEKRARLTAMTAVLSDLKQRFDSLHKTMFAVLPAFSVERSFTAFRAALRHGHIDEARAMRDEWLQHHSLLGDTARDTLAAQTGEILDIMRRQQDNLRVQDGFMLDESDTALLMSFMQGDEAMVDKYLRKYTLPYLALKLKFLLKLAYRLGRVGSLEALLVLHTRMIAGRVHPMYNLTRIKRHEEEVEQKIVLLLQDGFSDLPNIFQENEVMFAEIRALLDQVCAVMPAVSPAPKA